MKTESIDSVAVRQIYTHDTMRSALAVGNLGGLRPSIDSQGRLRHIAIVTADEDCARSISRNPYADQIENDVLTFTASGREGNQVLSGMNKRLVEQYEIPTPFFGFANTGTTDVSFSGLCWNCFDIILMCKQIERASSGMCGCSSSGYILSRPLFEFNKQEISYCCENRTL